MSTVKGADYMSKRPWSRVVIKVGSALISPNSDGCSSQYLLSIANFIVRCRLAGTQVVLVSSGSVAAGAHLFDKGGVNSVTLKKAMAASGQSEMIATWEKLFDFHTAQILVTHADLKEIDRYESIKETLDTLLQFNVLPVVNENDAVTTDKLRIGDNDNLSAMIATAIDAECLIICSDIDGLYDSNPKLNQNAQLISDVHKIDAKVKSMAGGASSGVGTGGMKTKLQAAEKAISSGIDAFIVNGFKESSFNQLLLGENPGTHFHASEKPLNETTHWVRHAAKAQGELIVSDNYQLDANSDDDILDSADIVDVCGDFNPGDLVILKRHNGERLAKVQTNYSSCLLNLIACNQQAAETHSFTTKNKQIISSTFIDLGGH